jgi:hypothetical protein
MNKKTSVFLLGLLCSSLPAIAVAGPFSGKTKSAYTDEIQQLVSSDNATDVDGAEDWGSCRDICYSDRTKCYEDGGDQYHCETVYDACTTNCNARW